MAKRREHTILIPATVAGHSRLTPTSKLVYGAMLAYARKTGCCFASQARIAARLAVTRESVNRAITQLKSERCIRPLEDITALRGGLLGGRTDAWECLVDVPQPAKPKLVSMPRKPA